jgi:hypothetical protein
MFKQDRIKTTFMGIATIFGAIYNFITTKDIVNSGSTFMAGIGLILAKDGTDTTTP